ncbi:MAG TPA: autotransporter domain-containing protein, partial [Bradyrhizobium sp.]
SLRFRDAFLGTVAAGALSLAFTVPTLAGPDACTTSGGGTIETCTGNQSAGITILLPATLTTLNVNNLTQAIAPASGTSGIGFLSNGAITITSDTGAFGITTTGANASGILAASTGAGAVTVTSTGNIAATGDQAQGIYADSVTAATVTSTGNITTAGSGSTGIYSRSTGGAVAVTSIGNIATTGGGAYGIKAAGAGAVSVSSTGNITTKGSSAPGIYADSANGAVTVISTGNITTAGERAHGIYAIGVGTVTVTSTGNITTTGNNASGIFAQGGGYAETVTVKSGTVSGGSGSGAGVVLNGGATNTLTNMGTVTALSGLAIKGDIGNNTVDNSGTVIGNVVLGTGTNAFNNMAGGLFNSGATVNLGAGNVLTNAGTLSPGGAGVIQTTALSGNLVQTATGRLLVDINVAGATSDRINVSGTANLAGAVQLQVSNPTFAPWQQTIVSATGGTTNNGLSLLASPVLQVQQLVFPNATDVVVESAGLNFVTPGLNNNQTALANALNGAAHADGLGGPVFDFLLNGVTSLPGYALALNQLTGEAATGSQQTTFDAMNMFMGTMLDPSNRGTTSTPGGSASGYASEAEASAYAAGKNAGAAYDAYAMFTKAPPVVPFEQRWSVWAAGFGGSQTTDGNATVGSNNTTSSVYGTAVAADYRISPFTVAGFALAGGGTNFSVAGSGSGHSDLFQAGAFIKHTVGAAYLSAALAYGWQDITTDRTLAVAGTNQLRAQFNANAFSGRLEGGYRFVASWVGGIGITPYAATQFTTFDLPGYAEQAIVGSDAFALAYGARDVTDTRSELGLRADKSFGMTDGILTLRGRVAWAHDYDPDRSIAATFQTLPGASFVVNGAAQASDSALVTASVEKKWLNGWSAAATFEGEFSDVTRSYSGKGVVRYQW